MMLRTAFTFVLVLGAAFAGACGSRHATPPADAWIRETEQFRAKHETDYRRDYVALAGLFFHFIFRDGTSGKETYDTARFLYSDLKEDGTTVMDFNQAYNPPCSFNPFTTCPLPIAENRLTVRILAGEKAYPHP